MTLPDGIVTQWAYDGAGHTTAYVNGNGDTITNTFDNAGRQTGVTYPSGAYSSEIEHRFQSKANSNSNSFRTVIPTVSEL